MNALELELGGCQARLQQVEIGVDAGLGALLLDANQVGGERFLLLGRSQFAG